MSLRVVEDAEVTKHDGATGSVCIESDAPSLSLQITELNSAKARELAMKHASKIGMESPRVTLGNCSPYAMTADGKILSDPVQEKAAYYRVDVPLIRGTT